MSQEHSTRKCPTTRFAKHLPGLLVASFFIVLARGTKAEGALADTYVTAFRAGASGAYTFTFDDGASGQWQHAVPILETHDMRGTFFLIGASVEAWYSTLGCIHVPQMLSIAAKGHEIGSHTYNHRSLTTLDDAGVHEQMALDKEFFRRWGIDVMSLAYPYSATDARVQSIVGQYVEFARDGYPRMTNSSVWKELNPLDLKWSSLSDDHFECVDTAIATGTWALGVFHQIGMGEGPTVETFAMFAEYVAARRDAGELWVGTVKEVASYIRERSSAVVTKRYDAETETITVGLNDGGLVYPYIVPLTLRTRIDGYDISSVSQGGMVMPYEVIDSGTGTIVQYDAIPGGGNIIIELTARKPEQ